MPGQLSSRELATGQTLNSEFYLTTYIVNFDFDFDFDFLFPQVKKENNNH